MTRMKYVIAAVLSAALLNFAPQLHAQITVKVILAGSSALWQSMALAAYKGGACVSGGTAPCFHYTAKNFNLIDSRPTAKGGANAVDPGNLWLVWDSNATSTNVWAYIRVDSGVGDRCYFGQPRCTISLPTVPAPANLIAQNLWGDNSSDTAPPSSIVALLQGGTLSVNAAATDIRPEDALFATCRANSALGGGPDGLAGLGYNAANASGVCPTFGATLAKLEGTDIQSAYPGSTSTAHVLAFGLSGKDPFTGTAIPAATTTSVGASPIIFITARNGAMSGVTNATDAQLHTAFGGSNCDASVFGGSGTIQVYLREPLSGTMNTTEYTVFRYPDKSGVSQETGVNAVNPFIGACASGGSRHRSVGTGEEVNYVLNSNSLFGTDGIGYTFFSYGNVSSIANSASYGYLTLNGVDGIFHKYGTTIDPGQPAIAGALPGAANLPATCAGGAGSFPCAEGKIWSGNLSFPNLRNGSYRAWSVLRVVSNGTALSAANLLVTGSQTYAVNSTPDFVPGVQVGSTDLGLALLRSHYTQAGVAPVNVATTGDRGGDAGGCILFSTRVANSSDTTTKLAQQEPGTSCVQVP